MGSPEICDTTVVTTVTATATATTTVPTTVPVTVTVTATVVTTAGFEWRRFGLWLSFGRRSLLLLLRVRSMEAKQKQGRQAGCHCGDRWARAWAAGVVVIRGLETSRARERSGI